MRIAQPLQRWGARAITIKSAKLTTENCLIHQPITAQLSVLRSALLAPMDPTDESVGYSHSSASPQKSFDWFSEGWELNHRRRAAKCL